MTFVQAYRAIAVTGHATAPAAMATLLALAELLQENLRLRLALACNIREATEKQIEQAQQVQRDLGCLDESGPPEIVHQHHYLVLACHNDDQLRAIMPLFVRVPRNSPALRPDAAPGTEPPAVGPAPADPPAQPVDPPAQPAAADPPAPAGVAGPADAAVVKKPRAPRRKAGEAPKRTTGRKKATEAEAQGEAVGVGVEQVDAGTAATVGAVATAATGQRKPRKLAANGARAARVRAQQAPPEAPAVSEAQAVSGSSAERPLPLDLEAAVPPEQIEPAGDDAAEAS